VNVANAGGSRQFRRIAGWSAIVAGGAGIVANGALLSYYALARPWEPGHAGPWEWLGPANDIIGSVSMVALVPVIAFVGRAARDDRPLVVLGIGGGLAAAALAAGGPLLVAGAITLPIQFVVAGLGLPVIFGWLGRANRVARRTGLLPPRTTALGRCVAFAALTASALALIGVALPAGSVAQYVALGLAALAGLPAYLAFPIWEIMAGQTWRADGLRVRRRVAPTRSIRDRGSDQAETPDRVPLVGELGDRGVDPGPGEVVDLQALDDLPRST